ncbi:hypothetical protein BZL41_12150 [Pseudomonas sp. PIC25]|nr:hypothetical protein BZL41_12150 [Pseudomonas sp. PIC25]
MMRARVVGFQFPVLQLLDDSVCVFGDFARVLQQITGIDRQLLDDRVEGMLVPRVGKHGQGIFEVVQFLQVTFKFIDDWIGSGLCVVAGFVGMV